MSDTGNNQPNITRNEIREALAEICTSYHLVVGCEQRAHEDWRATGALEWNLFLFKDTFGKVYLRARTTADNKHSDYRWQKNVWGCLPGTPDLFKNHTFVADQRSDNPILVGKNRHFNLSEKWLQQNQFFDANGLVSITDYEPRTESQVTGSITTTSESHWDIEGEITGSKKDGGGIGIKPSGGESKSTSRTMDIRNFEVNSYGSPPYWQHNIQGREADAKLNPPMMSEFILQFTPDAQGQLPVVDLSFFFGCHFWRASEHNAFCAGIAPLTINPNDLTIGLTNPATGTLGYQHNKLVKEPGLPFESNIFGGDVIELYTKAREATTSRVA